MGTETCERQSYTFIYRSNQVDDKCSTCILRDKCSTISEWLTAHRRCAPIQCFVSPGSDLSSIQWVVGYIIYMKTSAVTQTDVTLGTSITLAVAQLSAGRNTCLRLSTYLPPPGCIQYCHPGDTPSGTDIPAAALPTTPSLGLSVQNAH